MLLKGFKFGMLLQFAIGPMCLMVFNTSSSYGFWMGLSLVLAIALVDSLYITLSCLGAAALLGRERVKRAVKWLGFVVLALFGVQTIAGAFHFSIFPELRLFSQSTGQSVFIQGVLLTASNPLTIIFWSGVFSAQIAENDYGKRQLILFGVGCVLSTLFFLTVVAVCGSFMKGFLPPLLIQILNVAVGVLLICCGIRLLSKQKN